MNTEETDICDECGELGSLTDGLCPLCYEDMEHENEQALAAEEDDNEP